MSCTLGFVRPPWDPFLTDPSFFYANQPSAQRRPPNAFILFSQSIRASVQTENPGLNNIQYTQILAQMWRSLPQKEKCVFQHMAATMQSHFKQTNPNFSYRKTVKKKRCVTAAGSSTKEAAGKPNPFEFRWDQMLNHHDE
jgi:hypothetical protein